MKKPTAKLQALAAVNEIETATRLICGPDCNRDAADYTLYAGEVSKSLKYLRSALSAMKPAKRKAA